MLAWMVYAWLVSALLAGAAYAGERSALLRKAPTRWLWGLCILACLVAPVAISNLAVQLPALSAAAGHVASSRTLPLRQITSQVITPSAWLIAVAGRASAGPGVDQGLTLAWAAASGVLLLAIAINAGLLMRRKRAWRLDRVSGAEVYVAPDVGPAIVGLLGPRIVVPSWLLDASADEQSLVIAHEQSHLEAGDAQALAIAVLAIVAMPWNLPLWWCLRRLRNAIEVDCDARVLRRGHSVTSYGAALIMVGERQSAPFAVVAGMSESKSFLEQRIRTMLSKRKKFAGVSAAALACLGFVLAASAAEVSPPDAPGAWAERPTVAVDPARLQDYVGFYKLGEGAVATVTRDGAQLSMQLTGQQAYPIFPQSDKDFFFKVVDAQVSFVAGADGKVTSLVLHQSGQTIVMPRIDEATAKAVEADSQQKYSSQAQTPGTEAALRRLIDGVVSGVPDYSIMTPALADATRPQLPKLQAFVTGLGAVKSVQFLGVDSAGDDVYDVRQEHGVANWRLTLNSQGLIATAWVRPGP